MRIHLATTPNDKPVSFDYQQKLVGVLHKWLGGDNNEHGNMSLYSFSCMGRKTKRFFCGMGKCGARCLFTKRYGKREIKTE